MHGSVDFENLESYFREIRKRVDVSERFSTVPSGLGLREDGDPRSDNLGNICNNVIANMSVDNSNMEKFRKQIFDFVFSTGEESSRNIADSEITIEAKFFACVAKYAALNQLFKNKNFDSDLKSEVERLGEFFKQNVAPQYKREDKRELLGKASSSAVFNTLFLAIRSGNRYNSDFIDTMFDAVPEFVRNSEINFQGTDMINQLVAPSNQKYNFKLAKKCILENPKSIYSYCATNDHKSKINDNSSGFGRNLFYDFAKVSDDGEISFDETRSESSLLSNIISIMYDASTTEDNRKQATELFFSALDALNRLIESGEDQEEVSRGINYYLNCKTSIKTQAVVNLNNCEFISPLDAIVREMKKVKNDSKEAGILSKSLNLLTSEKIRLKTIGELKEEKCRTKFESKLEALELELKSLGDRLEENKEKLDKIPPVRIARRILDFFIGIFGKIIGVKFNTPTRIRREVTDEIREVEGEINKNRSKHEKFENLLSEFHGNSSEIDKEGHARGEIERNARELSKSLKNTSSTKKLAPHHHHTK
ncbi:MAG: hypothetical protein LBB24_00225 [Rickettsiales bacterium]|jgi:chaperonin cofactor prefoldin|nr:hypothetical protein [Rickettsiales bacterium]